MKKLIGLGVAILVNVVLFSAFVTQTAPPPEGEVHITEFYEGYRVVSSREN